MKKSQKYLAEIKKRLTFAIPFREAWDKIIDNIERQVQASTEKNAIESRALISLEELRMSGES